MNGGIETSDNGGAIECISMYCTHRSRSATLPATPLPDCDSHRPSFLCVEECPAAHRLLPHLQIT